MTIPHIPLVTTPVRQINERLFYLHRLCATGTASRVQLDELDRLCAVMGTSQDNKTIGGADGTTDA